MINQTEQTLYRLDILNKQQQRVSYQMSNQRKLQNGSDDAQLYTREVYVEDKIRMYEGIKTQIEKTAAQNDVSDSTIVEMKKRLTFIKSEMMKANTDTTTSVGIKAIAINLQGERETLLNLVNTRIEGEYLFSGGDTSIKPFSKDTSGNIVYNGDNQLRKVVVEDGSYRQRGLTGYDLMYYPTSTAYKNEILEFNEKSKIFDEDGFEWKLNSPANDTLVKFDLDGNTTTETISGVVNDGATPPNFSVVMPNTDGLKFVAKTNIFDDLNDMINSLNGVDKLGNPISEQDAKDGISKGVDIVSKAFDGVNVAHAKLGGRNKVFETSLERISHKLTQFNVLSKDISSADLSKVAIEAKALEITYTALYSTINKTNQLSLVNFLN